MRSIAAALLLSLAAAAGAADKARPQPFRQGSMQAIVEKNADRPLVVNFWSLDCAYCHEELAVLREVAKKHPGWRVVLVSTDRAEESAKAAAALKKHGFEPSRTWIFAESPAEKLRFDIDRRWHGELPRTYFFAGGKRSAVSGRLKAEQIEARLAGEAR
jgi:thiol-disulfide isomerase/thioredoxin